MEVEAQVPKPKRARPADLAIVSSRMRESPAEEERQKREYAELLARLDKEFDEARGKPPPDLHAQWAAEFRESWDWLWAENFGDFEDTTKIPSMRFTDNPPPRSAASICDTLQIISVKVVELRGSLQWPLHVCGTVALRDAVDKNRNIIFRRERDDCQTLTQEDSNLALTGPTRAVVFLRPVTFEVELKVKGMTEFEDKALSYIAAHLTHAAPLSSCLLVRNYKSKLSTVEFTYGHICCSVEATIKVEVIRGSWHDYQCQFFARTASISEEVLLLDSGNKEVVVTDDGKIELSREVVSVEHKGKLMVSVKAWQGGNFIVKKEKGFPPKKAGRSHCTLDVGFCKMRVTVAWSLISDFP